MKRREAIELMSAASLAAGFTWTRPEVERAWAAVGAARRREAGQGFEPQFFTTHEWAIVRLLADIVIPRDRRSGSATDAGVPEFMDFVMSERENDARRTAMRGGLAWLDIESHKRFSKADFLSATDAERRAILDDIAYPERAEPDVSHGVQFFNSFRNLVASGFWSSKMGVADLQYMGNAAVDEWNGCPPEQLRKLGL